MYKKVGILILLVSASISLGLMSNTYSRYVADTKGNIDILFAKWQILVNTIDVTSNSSSSISFEPVIESNDNIASGVIAPTSKGHFDIEVDPSNVEVSFKYTINLSIENENIPDLMITKYAIIPDDYVSGELELITLTDNTITNTLYYDNSADNFSHKPFTVRVYFEWYEGENELMNDEEDSKVNDETFKINADIKFEQEV